MRHGVEAQYDRQWWRAAAGRMARTAVAVFIPFIPAAVSGDSAGLLMAAQVIPLAVVLSMLTSLAGLPELAGAQVPVWKSALSRGLKTFAQVAVSVIGVSTIWAEVDWTSVVQDSLAAGIASILMAFLATGPETVDESPISDDDHLDNESDMSNT